MKCETIVWMPVHNEQDYLRTAIESVLNQTDKNFRFLISENYSTDHSLEIIQEYAKRDPRIYLIRPPTFMGGMVHGQWLISEVLQQLDFKYTCLIGGHDRWGANYLEELLRAAEASPNCSVTFGKTMRIDGNGNELGYLDGFFMNTSEISRALIPLVILTATSYCIYAFGLWNSQSLKKVTKIFNCTAQDHLLMAELALQGNFNYTEKTTFYVREKNSMDSGITYIEKHLGKDNPGTFANLSRQIEWVTSLVDRATDGHPIYSKEPFKTMVNSATLSAYIVRYIQPIEFEQGSFLKLCGDETFKSILATHYGLSELFAKFSQQYIG